MSRAQFNIDKLDRGCASLGLKLSPEQQENMVQHLALLASWNRRLNLTSIRSYDDMIVSHLLDSLAVHPWINGTRVLDIGSGAGFPGLPIAMAFPHTRVTLLDSRSRRVEFLRHVVLKTGINNVSVRHSRIEDYLATEKFDTLVARAFSSLEKMVNMCQKLLLPGTRILSLKGKRPDQEIENLPVDMAERVHVKTLSVPFLEAERHLVVIDI